MKTGLVLEGGAMRGMFTAGILDVFLDEGLDFDTIAGVSAGALFGVNYVSRQKGRAIRYNKRFNQDKNYLGLKPLFKEGNIVCVKYAYDDVPRKLDVFDDETYMKNVKEYYAVVTNVKTGNPEYVQIDSVFDQMDTLRASGSMPGVSKPVKIGEEEYLDGGISDSIPFKFLLENGCDKVVVILTRNLEYRKSPCNPLMLQLMRKTPVIKEKMAERHNEYNRSVEELLEYEKKGIAYVIRPDNPLNISRLERDPEKLQAVYDIGQRAAKDHLSKGLKTFLAN